MTKAKFIRGRTSKKHHPQVMLACLDAEGLPSSDEMQTSQQEFTEGVFINIGSVVSDAARSSAGTEERVASYMFRPGNSSIAERGEDTDSDPIGWKPIWRIAASPTANLRPRAQRFRNWIAHSSKAASNQESWLLERLLQPDPQVSGDFAAQWQIRLNEACRSADITAILQLCGLRDLAADIRDLEVLVKEDPESIPMDLDSLRHAAAFLISEQQFPYPLISITPEGSVWMEWKIAPAGLLGMNFLPSGLIQFVAIPHPPRRDVETESMEGTVHKEHMLGAIQPFLPELHPR